MAVVDARYNFIEVDVGALLKKLTVVCLPTQMLGQKLEMCLLDLPGPRYLPGTSILVPHVFVPDEPFRCKVWQRASEGFLSNWWHYW